VIQPGQTDLFRNDFPVACAAVRDRSCTYQEIWFDDYQRAMKQRHSRVVA